jgi:hypothetical protein
MTLPFFKFYELDDTKKLHFFIRSAVNTVAFFIPVTTRKSSSKFLRIIKKMLLILAVNHVKLHPNSISSSAKYFDLSILGVSLR